MARARRAGAVAIAALAAVSPATGTHSTSRIVDRTLVCRMSGIGYPDTVRFMHVGARQYQPAVGSPSINAGNGSPAVPGAGASVRTGPAGEGSGTTTGQVSLTRTATGRCANTRLRIPLSSRGLRGAPSDLFDIGYRCDVPAKVVIRVRAVFKRSTVFRVMPRFPDVEEATGDVVTGSIAVTTLRGRRPIAFASVRDAGKARVFVAPSRCRRNQP